MSDFGTLALASQGGQAAAGVANGVTQASAIRAQSSWDRAAADENARILDRQAADAEARGGQDASLIERRTRQLVGTQRARLAGQGVDVGTGSALDVQVDTQTMSEMDKLTARNNAAREAYGYRSQAQSVRTGASLQARAARGAARSTLLQSYTSGAKDLVLGGYYYDKMSGLSPGETEAKKKKGSP